MPAGAQLGHAYAKRMTNWSCAMGRTIGHAFVQNPPFICWSFGFFGNTL